MKALLLWQPCLRVDSLRIPECLTAGRWGRVFSCQLFPLPGLIFPLIYKSSCSPPSFPLSCCYPLTWNFSITHWKVGSYLKVSLPPNLCHHSWQLQHPGGGYRQLLASQFPGLSGNSTLIKGHPNSTSAWGHTLGFYHHQKLPAHKMVSDTMTSYAFYFAPISLFVSWLQQFIDCFYPSSPWRHFPSCLP